MNRRIPLTGRLRLAVLLPVLVGSGLAGCTDLRDPIAADPAADRLDASPTATVTAADMGVAAASPALVAVAAPALADPVIHFEDAFDGDALDPALWYEELATAGKRWCDPAGAWVDPTAPGGCNGVMASPPFGAAVVSGGLVGLSAGAIRAAPYLQVEGSPFPADGDFELELTVRHDALGPHGTGIRVLVWPDATPDGSNNPLAQNTFFFLWADSHAGIRAILLGETVPVPNDGLVHHYRISYIGGDYYLAIDDEPAVGPISVPVLPTALWMGNPLFIHGAPADWTDFSVDLVRVSVSAPPPPPAIGVALDLWPGSCEATLNTASRGVVPAAILGAADFDPATLDPESIRLEGVEPSRSSFEDVAGAECDAGPDGTDDLTLKFDTQELVAALGEPGDGDEVTLALTATLLPELGASEVAAEATVVVKVPPGKAAGPGAGPGPPGSVGPAPAGPADEGGPGKGKGKGKKPGS